MIIPALKFLLFLLTCVKEMSLLWMFLYRRIIFMMREEKRYGLSGEKSLLLYPVMLGFQRIGTKFLDNGCLILLKAVESQAPPLTKKGKPGGYLIRMVLQ